MPDLLEVFVRFGEEIVYLLVEVVGVFAQGAMARVRDNPEVGVGNVLIDEDGVGNRNEVVVATDDERRRLDSVELSECDVRLLPVEEKELCGRSFPWRWDSPCEARRRTPSFPRPRVLTERHRP
jgi:hypothetical protein